MLLATLLDRVFILKENGQDIRLPDPEPQWTVETVMNFYANTYPILTTSKISAPKIKDDAVEYRFESVVGTGNGKNTGQVLLSTIGNIKQPDSEKYETVANLPFVTEEFGELLKQSEQEDDTPSCSLAEALEKQDLYINSTLAQMGCSLLWNLFRNGLTEYRGFFLNLKNLHSQPIRV